MTAPISARMMSERRCSPAAGVATAARKRTGSAIRHVTRLSTPRFFLSIVRYSEGAGRKNRTRLSSRTTRSNGATTWRPGSARTRTTRPKRVTSPYSVMSRGVLVGFEPQRESVRVSLSACDPLLLEGQRPLGHRRGFALCLVDLLHCEDVRQVDRTKLVLERAGDVSEGVMDLVRRVVIEQADGKDLDSGLVAVQHRLGGRTRLAFDLLARCGVDRIDGAGRDRTPQRCQDRAAHECLRFGEMVGEGQRVLDPVLGRGPQVYEVAVAGEQKGVAGRRLLLEPDAARRLLWRWV